MALRGALRRGIQRYKENTTERQKRSEERQAKQLERLEKRAAIDQRKATAVRTIKVSRKVLGPFGTGFMGAPVMRKRVKKRKIRYKVNRRQNVNYDQSGRPILVQQGMPRSPAGMPAQPKPRWYDMGRQPAAQQQPRPKKKKLYAFITG